MNDNLNSLAKGARVLLIEENPEHVAAIQHSLAGTEFLLEHLADHWVATARLAHGDVAAVLFGVGSPDGEQFAAIRRVSALLGDAAVVVLGSLEDKTIASRALQEGAQDYLVKSHLSRHLLERSLHYAIQRKRSEQVLRQSAAIVESSDDGIISRTVEGDVVSWNKGAERIYGYSAEEMVGRNLSLLVPPERLRDVSEIMGAIKKGQRIDHFETERIRKDDKRIFVSITVSPIIDPVKGVRGASVIVRDITERKRAEATLRESEERYRSLVETARDTIFTVSRGGLFTSLNNAFEMLTGWTPAEWLGKHFAELVHPDDLPRATELFRDQLLGKSTPMFELRILTKAGRWKIAQTTSTLHIRDGDVVGVLGIARDITEHKQAEAELQESDERYRTLFETMDEGFCVIEMIHDPDGKVVDYRFVEINQAFEKQTGLQQALGKTIRQMVPNHEAYWFEIYGTVARTGEAVRFENPATAMQRYYDAYAFRIGAEGSRKVGILFNDITERKQAEAELQRSTEEIRDLYNNAPCGYHSLDKDGVFVRINDTELKWLGYARDEVIGKMRLTDILTPEGLTLFHEKFPLFKQQGWVSDLELELVRKDGTVLTALLSATAVRDVSGNYVMSRTTLFDITERKRAERVLATH